MYLAACESRAEESAAPPRIISCAGTRGATDRARIKVGEPPRSARRDAARQGSELLLRLDDVKVENLLVDREDDTARIEGLF